MASAPHWCASKFGSGCKIAQRYVGEALSLPLRRSRLGSLSEGAGSPNGLTEGVYFVERYKPIILHRPVGVANLATRCGAAAQKLTEVSSSLHGTSSRNCPLASPGGKLPDLTALRNRQGWLMRGGDRLVQECSWMSGICSGFLHSTEKSITFSHHHALMSLAALCNTPERAV